MSWREDERDVGVPASQQKGAAKSAVSVLEERGSGCQPSTLIVIEMEPLSPVQLLRDANLLLQELDLLPLLFVQPSGDRKEQHSHWHRQHGLQFTRSRTRIGTLKMRAF